MISAALVLLFTLTVNQLVIKNNQHRLAHKPGVFHLLFFYHLLFFVIYYLYAQSTTSDSFEYYRKVEEFYRGDTWLDFYGIGTIFIEFVAFPFIHYLNFSYEAMMLLFSYLGYLGFFYFYLFIAETTVFKHKIWGIDFILLLLFLPNMHFWSVSFGKGSIILCGIGLFCYGISNFRQRWLMLIIGALIIYQVRVHILLLLVVALFIGSIFSSKGISTVQKIGIVALSLLLLSPLLNSFLEYTGIQEADTEAFEAFAEKRGSGLTGATSGVEINNYNQFEKLFAFLFRPLFFDAPGALGLIVSFENLLYLFLFIKLFSIRFVRFLISSHWVIKFSLIAFLGISVALAQVSGNLGLAIRQKSQIMFLFFFVLLAYADWAYSQYGKKVIGE